MKLKSYILSVAVLMALLFSSCADKEQEPQVDFSSGVIVINEGNFSSANGSVSFYNPGNQQVTQDVFALANGASVGGLIQSVYFHDDRAFIIDNLGSRIYVVNANTFEIITTIEDGLNAPRYMVVADNQAYVSNWGPYDANFDLNESYVSVIDLQTYEETSSISTDSGCEGLFVDRAVKLIETSSV